MSSKERTRDKNLEVNLFNGMVEIESRLHANIGIEVTRIDPSSQVGGPKGALYQIEIYKPEPQAKVKPFEYDVAWVMSDGTIVKRGER